MAKSIYEVEHNGETYEVEADSAEEAAAAFAPPPAPEQNIPEEGPSLRDLSFGDIAEGAWEAAKGAVTGAVAQPVSGLVGLAATALSRDINVGADWQKMTEDALTDAPEGEAMQVFAKAIGPTIDNVTQTVDDAIYSATGGNPELAAATKTALYGLPAVVGLGRLKMPSRLRARVKQHADLARVKTQAAKEGISLEYSDLPETTMALARRQFDDLEKGANFDQVMDAMRKAEGISARNVDTAYETARATAAFAPTKALKTAAQDARKAIIEAGHDIEQMPAVRKRLQEMSRLERREVGTGKKFVKDAKREAASLNELDILRKRISNSIEGNEKLGKPFTPQDRALLVLKDKLDDTVDNLWRDAAISGDQAAQDAWRSARAMSKDHAQTFRADKAVRPMLIDGTTPEQAYRIMIGSSSMSAKPQAAALVRTIKRVLGPNSPALVNVRKAVLRDALEPMFRDSPNFGASISNIDKLLQNHPTLLNELDIDVAELRKIRKVAHATRRAITEHPEQFSGEYLSGLVSSVFFGHAIARKGAVVRTARKVINKAFGIGGLSKRQVQQLLLEGEFDVPISKMSGPAVTFWAAAKGAPKSLAAAERPVPMPLRNRSPASGRASSMKDVKDLAVAAAQDYRQFWAEHPIANVGIGFIPVVGQALGLADTAAASIDPQASSLEKGMGLVGITPFGKAMGGITKAIVVGPKGLLRMRRAGKAVAAEKANPEVGVLGEAMSDYEKLDVAPIHAKVQELIDAGHDVGKKSHRVGTLSNILHESGDLYTAYPHAKDIPIYVRLSDTGGGSYIPADRSNNLPFGAIRLNINPKGDFRNLTGSKEAVKRSLGHEIQHGAQDVGEDWTKLAPSYTGESPDRVGYINYMFNNGELLARVDGARAGWTEAQKAAIPCNKHLQAEIMRVSHGMVNKGKLFDDMLEMDDPATVQKWVERYAKEGIDPRAKLAMDGPQWKPPPADAILTKKMTVNEFLNTMPSNKERVTKLVAAQDTTTSPISRAMRRGEQIDPVELKVKMGPRGWEVQDLDGAKRAVQVAKNYGDQEIPVILRPVGMGKFDPMNIGPEGRKKLEAASVWAKK